MNVRGVYVAAAWVMAILCVIAGIGYFGSGFLYPVARPLMDSSCWDDFIVLFGLACLLAGAAFLAIAGIFGREIRPRVFIQLPLVIIGGYVVFVVVYLVHVLSGGV